MNSKKKGTVLLLSSLFLIFTSLVFFIIGCNSDKLISDINRRLALTILILSVILLIYSVFLLIRFMITQKDRIDIKTSTSLLLIISGGISNLIDRIFRGGVVDFIDISQVINFPKFNLADICIVVGCILFVLYAAIHTNEIIQERKKKFERIKKDN